MGARKLPKPLAGAKSVNCLPCSKVACGRFVGGRGEEGSQSTTGEKKLRAGRLQRAGAAWRQKKVSYRRSSTDGEGESVDKTNWVFVLK